MATISSHNCISTGVTMTALAQKVNKIFTMNSVRLHSTIFQLYHLAEIRLDQWKTLCDGAARCVL